jgi:cobalamin biosynthesis protein CobT
VSAEALAKVANAIGKKHGLSVRFSGSGAHTTEKVITLPALPEGGLTDEVLAVTKGLCDHEVLHHRFSAFEPVLKKINKMPNPKPVHSMTNLIEDIRIERKGGMEYVGMKENLEKALADPKWLGGEMDNPIGRLCHAGRTALCGYKWERNYEAEAKKEFGADIFDKIAACESTWDALALALELLKRDEDGNRTDPQGGDDADGSEQGEGEPVEGKKGDPEKDPKKDPKKGDEKPDTKTDKKGDKKAEEKPEELEKTDEKSDKEADERAPNKADKADDGESDDGEGDDEDIAADEADGDDDGEGDSEGADDGEGSDEGEGDTEGGGEESEDEADDETTSEPSKSGCENPTSPGLPPEKLEEAIDDYSDVYDEMKESLERATKEALSAGKYMVWDKSMDRVKVIPPAMDTGIFDGFRRDLKGLNSAATKMANMFLARTESRWVQDREQGKVNVRALAKVKVGYRNVYKEKMISTDRDTAITLLNDCSGSMRGDKVQAAMRATVMFLECLQLAKIKTEVLAYTTGEVTIGRGVETRTAWTYGRIEALITYVYKTFDEVYGAAVKKRISNYHFTQMNNNCDGDSVRLAADRLLKRKEKRKILIVLTDGNVCHAGDDAAGAKYLHDVIPVIEKQGVEVIAVAIGTADLARRDYRRVIAVDKCGSNLERNILDGLKEVMKVSRIAA